MRRSLHPPHVVEKSEAVPNAAFPFCKYDNDPTVGKYLHNYKENYCKAFQVSSFIGLRLFIECEMKFKGSKPGHLAMLHLSFSVIHEQTFFLIKFGSRVEMGPDPTRPKLTFDPQ